MTSRLAPALLLLTFVPPTIQPSSPKPHTLVLGVAQDGGAPQAGSKRHPGWQNPRFRAYAASLAIVDPASQQRWLIDATPDFKQQLRLLDERFPVESAPGLSGIFLTHAHIGHYLGLAQLGHEAMGAQGVPVFAMPRMRDFLSSNGPWDQLVRYGNIRLVALEAGVPVRLNSRLTITPVPVPHRQEYSEVVAFYLEGPRYSLLYLPDIDSWTEWDRSGERIEAWISRVDTAYLDGTFFADGEIPGRDMSGFPHPFISTSLKRLKGLPPMERAKVRFIHLNHTNPALDPESPQRRRVEEAGFTVARRLERRPL